VRLLVGSQGSLGPVVFVSCSVSRIELILDWILDIV
jgi:hypothetical protein